eukprot:Hpha_TRINITY_DN16373_c1_g1::TRINITY_DN16373_c1_g1_i1::g.62384::m.62384/K08737/MSH6; DNA mismatch repair protein MSH6
MLGFGAAKTATPSVNKLVEHLKNPKNIKDLKGRGVDDPDYDPRRLGGFPERWLDEMKSFDRQFWRIKKDHFDTVLFMKCGSFYELYDRDADVAAKELDMKYRTNHTCSMRTCGFPEKAINQYAARLIGRGYKVGRVEEMKKTDNDRAAEDDKDSKTVKRALCQVLTLASLTDLDMLLDEAPQYTLAVKEAGDCIGACLADLARGSFRFARLAGDSELATLLHAAKPKELLLERGAVSKDVVAMIAAELPPASTRRTMLDGGKEFLSAEAARERIRTGNHFNTDPLPKGLDAVWGDDAVMSAVGAMVWHLTDIKLIDQLLPLQNFGPYDPTEDGTCLALDASTLSNLNLIEPSAPGGSTVLQSINHCVTPFGRERLRRWLCSPLRDVGAIEKRQDAVAELVENPGRLRTLRDALKGFPSLDRFVGRLGAAGREPDVTWINAQAQNKRLIDLYTRTLAAFDRARLWVSKQHEFESTLLRRLTCDSGRGGGFPDLSAALGECNSGFEIEDEGCSLRPLPGSWDEYDQQNAQLQAIRGRLQQHLAEARKHYGRGDAKRSKAVFWHFGKEHYVVEVPRKETQGLKPFPGFTEFKSTAQVIRYHSASISGLIKSCLDVQAACNALLRSFLKKRLQRFSEFGPVWREALECLGTLDCLASLAAVSSLPGMCRPMLVQRNVAAGAAASMHFRGLVHPLARPAVGSNTDTVVPNDLSLGVDGVPSAAVITGPNMGGKSTLMRAVCVAVVLAQLGSYVPAVEARLSPVDRIFTRIGASDKILSGLSTFMVEMRETSEMLRHATRDSLLVLDELGRGTATHDGYAIAHAVLNDIVTRLRCRCLFSTHYHQLCNDVGHMSSSVSMHHMRFETDPITRAVSFMYRLGAGSSGGSYGVDVARKAGLPDEVLHRAQVASDKCRANGLDALKEHGAIVARSAAVRVLRALRRSREEGVSDDVSAALELTPPLAKRARTAPPSECETDARARTSLPLQDNGAMRHEQTVPLVDVTPKSLCVDLSSP